MGPIGNNNTLVYTSKGDQGSGLQESEGVSLLLYDDVLRHIFSYLNSDELEVTALVNRRWHDLSIDVGRLRTFTPIFREIFLIEDELNKKPSESSKEVVVKLQKAVETMKTWSFGNQKEIQESVVTAKKAVAQILSHLEEKDFDVWSTGDRYSFFLRDLNGNFEPRLLAMHYKNLSREMSRNKPFESIRSIKEYSAVLAFYGDVELALIVADHSSNSDQLVKIICDIMIFRGDRDGAQRVAETFVGEAKNRLLEYVKCCPKKEFYEIFKMLY